MKKRIIAKIASIVTMLALLLTMTAVSATAVSAEDDPTLGNGTTYYVDSQSGSDSNNGTSSSTAWKTLSKVNGITFQPGDNILFKKGGVWQGTLSPKGSGSAGSPITISAYGSSTSMPLIDGNGVQFVQGGSWVDAPVYFCNQSYWTVQNLEVTNYSSTVGDRSGIHFDNTTTQQTRYGITIRNNKVHNISSNGNAGDHGRISGICVWSRSWYNSFSNVLIENNEVYDIGSTGIMVNAECPADSANGGKNVVVRNNTLNRIGGDGILTNECVAPLVEYNVVNESHNVSTAACVALWPFACTDSVFQFNEAYNTKTRMDGQGFDSDYMCTGTTFQYNYGHDNEGGFFLICCEPTNWDGSKVGFNDGTVVRYNISQNNLKEQFGLFTNITNTTIYNNTIYTKWGLDTNVVYTGSRNGVLYPDNTKFYNNLIYSLSASSYTWGNSTNTVWQNNLVYGTNASGAPADPNAVYSNPKLVNPGSAGIGFASCDAYKLYQDSPAIGAGKVIANNGGHDFFGNAVSATAAPNIGAYNGAGLVNNVQTTSYAGGYRNLHNWEDALLTDTNLKIPFISGDTTTWLSTASITTNSNVLAPNGSTKAIKVHNNQTSAQNCAVHAVVYKEWITESTGMRFWLDGNGVSNQNVEIMFRGPNSMKYIKSTTVPANGGWIDIGWTDTLYKSGPDTWGNVTVTPEIMRNTTSLLITFKNLAAGGDMYIDDIQYKVNAQATTSSSSTTTTVATTTAATTTTTSAPPQGQEYQNIYDWDSATLGATNASISGVSCGDTTTWLSTVSVVDTASVLAPGSTKALKIYNKTTSASNCAVQLLVASGSLDNATGMRIWMDANGATQSTTIQFRCSDGAKYRKTYTVPADGGWVDISFNDVMYKDGPDVWANVTVTPEILRNASSIFITFNSLPASANVYMDNVQISVPVAAPTSSTMYDWDSATMGATNASISGVSCGDTTTWLSTVSVVDTASVLAPDSTKALKIHNKTTSASNCAVQLLVASGSLDNATGVRIWMDANGATQSTTIQFRCSDGAKYRKTYNVPADGGWVDISFNDVMYKDGPDVWANVTVTPEILRNASSIFITFNSLPASADVYMDDVIATY